MPRLLLPRFRVGHGLITLSLALALAWMPGCSETTEPRIPDGGTGVVTVDGSIDPTGREFVLKSLAVPNADGIPVQVVLVGRNLRVFPDRKEVVLDVALRNADHRNLYRPAEVVLTRFSPLNVYPKNADAVACPNDVGPERPQPGSCFYTYDYSTEVGDGPLEPGEQSGFRTWVFTSQDQAGFSFEATVRIGLQPDASRIAGIFFHDPNRNGRMDPNETPFGGGHVIATGPGLDETNVFVGENGRYSIPVDDPGLYTVRAVPPPSLVPLDFTTPNPLEVLLTPGPDGTVSSFLNADFGLVTADLPIYPPIVLTDGPADSLEQDPFSLIDIGLDGTILKLDVGFSGCSPDHPFQLYMVGGFMESNPVQVRLVLSHDDRGELCRAAWRRSLAYDLGPLIESYLRTYPRPVRIGMNFRDWNGQVHRIDLNIGS